MLIADSANEEVQREQYWPDGIPFDAKGLTTDEAQWRLAQFGSNNILSELEHGVSRVLLDTAKDPMIWLLLSTSALFAWTGDRIEATILALATSPIVGMDTFLHRRTSVSTAALAGQLSPTCLAFRDGTLKTIKAIDLVPGDVLVVRSNESFSADGVIISGHNIQVDESALTGEAMPVRKQVTQQSRLNSVAKSARDSWISAGTRLLTGEA